MIIKNLGFKKVINTVCNLLIAVTPLILSQSTHSFFWGEPECPEILKNNIESS